MNSREVAISFPCDGSRLYGILHRPSHPSSRGVVLLAGRPALRSGRHRLFVLLARTWAEAGTPVLRFDYRGTGDSEGEMASLEETREEISAAIHAFQSNLPGLQDVVLWGLCGGAADAVLYAPQDARVSGIVLANPWLYHSPLRTLVGLHHRGAIFLGNTRRFISRLRGYSKAKQEDQSAFSSQRDPEAKNNPSAESMTGETLDASSSLESATVDRAYRSYREADISKRLAESVQHFRGRVLIILSRKDSGARAFKHAASLSLRWRRALASKRVQTHELPEANHSLRRPEWRNEAATLTIEWLRASD